MIPYSWTRYLSYYYGTPDDKNCIKKDRRYISGNMQGALSIDIDMSKAKSKAKEMNVAFGDLMLGIVSKVLKQHFNS